MNYLKQWYCQDAGVEQTPKPALTQGENQIKHDNRGKNSCKPDLKYKDLHKKH